MAHRHNCQKAPLTEKPHSAAAVNATLRAVTLPAPKARVSRSLSKLETTVPKEMIIYRMPAQETGTSHC